MLLPCWLLAGQEQGQSQGSVMTRWTRWHSVADVEPRRWPHSQSHADGTCVVLSAVVFMVCWLVTEAMLVRDLPAWAEHTATAVLSSSPHPVPRCSCGTSRTASRATPTLSWRP